MLFRTKKVINVVYLNGIISSKGKRSLSLSNIKPLLDKAFKKTKSVQAVALIINSPGGSASQTEIIANYIKYLSQETKLDVIAFIEDVAASGGYFLATVAPEIYALAQTSIVGSIGVLYSGFGFPDFIKKHGIERRIYTAGEDKVILDSFKEEDPKDIAIIKNLLQEIHTHFKNFIINSRKDKLNSNLEDLFSGKFWLASQAGKLGLIDGIVPSYESFLKEKYGNKIKLNIIKGKKGFMNNLLYANLNIEKENIEDILTTLEESINFNTIKFKKEF